MTLLVFLDVLVKSLSDERREIQVVFLNPLVLVLSESDCGPFHRMQHIYYMHKNITTPWACHRIVYENRAALYPLPAPAFGAR